MASIQYSNRTGIITGTSSADTIIAGFDDIGDDRIVALGGSDEIFSGGGKDFVLGGSGDDFISGEGGNDKLFGGTGSDDIFGGSGDDTLFVETNLSKFGTDSFSGGDGFDTLAFGTGSVINVNGTPNQVFFTDPEAGVSVNLINTFVAGITTTFQQGTGGEDFVNLGTELGRIRGPNNSAPVLADIERIQLTAFDDQIFDSTASHEIDGLDGDDYLFGGGGADVIDGGDGNDTAMYGGSAAAVSIVLLELTPGNGGTGAGGDAEGDRLFGIENVFGSGHGDFMLGDGAANILRGRDGNDSLLGGGGADSLIGELDNDTLRGGLGNDRVDGGDGVDTALFLDWNGTSFTILTPVSTVITLANGESEGSAVLLRKSFTKGGVATATLETDTLVSIENVNGTDFFDTIKGNDSANTLNGLDGNDLLDGGRGSDILNGGDGTDTASFAIGTLVEFERADASLITGKATVSRSHFELSQIVTTVETDTLQGIENLTGTTGSDTLTGNGAVNTLDGGNGNDTLAGLGGGDKLIGGDGFDMADYRAEAGVTVDLQNAILDGAAFGDILAGIEGVFGGNGDNTLKGDGNANTFIVTGGDNLLQGRGGDDTITGGAGRDNISGGTENDTLSGNGLRDRLNGNAGDDTLAGGDGGDFLTGGTGNDTQTGGTGADTFIFAGNAGIDTILDFEDGTDTIEIDNNKAATFADLGIANNGTAHVTVTYGVNTIEVFGAAPITLAAEDFSIL